MKSPTPLVCLATLATACLQAQTVPATPSVSNLAQIDSGSVPLNHPIPNTSAETAAINATLARTLTYLEGSTTPGYFDAAARQVLQFSGHLHKKGNNLCRQVWVGSIQRQLSYHWARTNGWAPAAMTDLLDVIPENHPACAALLNQSHSHIEGLVGAEMIRLREGRGAGNWMNDSAVQFTAQQDSAAR